MANISCNTPHPTAIVCDSGLFRQLSCPVTAAVSHSHHPGWDWGPSLQELRWSTVTQGFLTCSSLGFPQHSPRRLDPYNNLMAAQQHKYQPKDFPSFYPHSLCARTVWGLPAEPSAPAVSLSVPAWAARPRALCGAKARPLLGAVATQSSAPDTAAHGAPCAECAPAETGLWGSGSAFTPGPSI